MKKHYYAAFMPALEGDGSFDIVIPDVPNCFTSGTDMDNAMLMAKGVLDMMLRDMVERGQAVPPPSDLEAVKEKTAEHLRDIDHAPGGEIQYLLIPAPNLDQTPVKISISLSRAVLDEVDRRAKEHGFTRSGFLAHAAQAYHVERA